MVRVHGDLVDQTQRGSADANQVVHDLPHGVADNGHAGLGQDQPVRAQQ